MLRFHMSVVTRDTALKRSIKRLTTATGATADFVADGGHINSTRSINLAIFDARHDLPNPPYLAQIPRSARILYIVTSEDLVGRVSLFEDPRVTSLFCHDDRFDDDEFISSATKALRGEIFGLQKYFPWGVTTFTMQVKNYEEKTRAINIIMRYAQLAGVRGPVRDRIQLVADELMMNALYHAPVDDRGQEKHLGMTVKQLSQLAEVEPIQVQYGCSGRYFGLSVRDGAGSLQRSRALEYLGRSRAGTEMEEKQGGAGLGLISVMHSVSKLVFNLAPGRSTEVIGLLDMELFARGKTGARSLHLFTAAAPVPVVEEKKPEAAGTRTQARPRGRVGGWVAAALVGAAVACVGAGTYFERTGRSLLATIVEPDSLSLIVRSEPSAAAITVNGQRVASGVTVQVPRVPPEIQVHVAHPGYLAWSRILSAREASGAMQIFVRLDRGM